MWKFTESGFERMPAFAMTAYIGLGSNLGDREKHLQQAVFLLNREPHVRVEQCSRVYETDPVGYTEQPAFLNMVAKISTTLSPEPLLDVCLRIEQALGRVRNVRWGPRTIDLDLLLYGDLSLETPRLCLPHPRMHERLFVLIPLLEVLPEEDLRAASFRKSVENLEGKEGVRSWKEINWPSVFEHSAN